MARAKSNGSFLIKPTGEVQFIGGAGGDNQIVTYNPDFKSLENTNLEDLFGGSCVSQYLPDPPSKRPRGADLEVGDFWTNSEDKLIHIWDGEKWVPVNSNNGNPVGTVVVTIKPTVSLGYLRCDGTLCPEEYEELRTLLFDTNGDFLLPLLPQIPGQYNYIKY